jgi:GNAT superfamily N-acetyltransferase
MLGMSVHPAWHGQGVGQLLLQTLIDWAETTPAITARP